MGSSLFAGISGLNASSKQMDVIGNNIANVNTMGYRSAKIYFGDILSRSIAGGSQVGRGVSVSSVSTQFAPGSFETTANATDLAINGDGFFMVNDNDGGRYYTRAGAFHLDSDGNMVDVNNYKVQGYNFFGGDPNTITDISLQNVQSAPSATTTVSFGLNLDGETATGNTFNAAQTIYDSLGAEHTMKTTFQKTEESGFWSFQAYLDDIETTSQTYSGFKFDSDGALEKLYDPTAAAAVGATNTGTGSVTTPPVYDNQGQLYQDGDVTLTYVAAGDSWTISSPEYTNATVTTASATSLTIDLDGEGGKDMTLTLGGTGSILYDNNDTITVTVNQSATEVDPVDVSLTFPALISGATIGDSGVITWDLAGDSAEMMTGYASVSAVQSLTSDGYSSGILKNLSVTQDGILSGFFTNGQTAGVGQVVLADFSNPWGLKRMGNNLFSGTITSGSAIQNIPGSAGMGDINPNSLEMSNTDIATEFINMITAQRAYQASAKVVTTTDAMMSELMNIKR